MRTKKTKKTVNQNLFKLDMLENFFRIKGVEVK